MTMLYESPMLENIHKVSFQVLSELFESEKPLSIYEFEEKFTLHQYRYWCQKLEKNLFIKSVKNGKKREYKLNDYYQEEVHKMLALKEKTRPTPPKHLSPLLKGNEKFLRLLSLLKKEKNWAFADTTALLLWVPYLDLSVSKFTVSVRDKSLERKLQENLPSDLLEIKLLPSFFIRTKGLTVLNDIPVLKPEFLFYRLLKTPNERLRLSSFFLLPYLNPKSLARKLDKNKELYPPITYFLLALRMYLNEDHHNQLLKNWFFNLDHFNWEKLFSSYLQVIGKKNLKTPYKTVFRKYKLKRLKYQLKTNQWDVWDRLALLFPKRNLTFSPGFFKELMNLQYASN